MLEIKSSPFPSSYILQVFQKSEFSLPKTIEFVPKLLCLFLGETDTVCVIGIVRVKVIGSIENGERIYASRDRPGKAVPQSQVPVGTFLRKKHVLLGMALEGKKCPKTPDEVHLVKCFVCVVLDVSRQELLEEIEDLYKINEIKTVEQIKLHSKKTWRSMYLKF